MWPFGRGADGRKTGYQSTGPRNSKSINSQEEALSLSAYWAAIRLLTEVVASMPVKCYKTNLETNVKTVTTDYDLWNLINYNPNRYQTRTEFIESLMFALSSRGNSYCAIEKLNGRIVSLMPLVSGQMEVKLLEDGSVVYEYSDANSNLKVFAAESIWHVKLFGNGIVGLSPLQYAAKALGIAYELDNRMGVLAANGGKTNGILTIDKALTEKQREAMKESYAGMTEGNADQLFVLEAGFQYQQTSLSPSDMQLIENRRFQIEDIARFIGVPSVLINDTSASTTWGSGIEQITQGFYKLNLRPYLERYESSIMRWLMPRSDWGKVSIEFDFDALLRADKATRLDAASKGVNAGIIMPDEARSDEGLPPAKGGDTIYLNGSLVPGGTQPMQRGVVSDGN